ncbi:hypothetical protein BYT27DRAFT_7202696 [Phlegmacium glaucopus]|nr:hypothetical protein BYT27DRAFT_7202696 [Phlegmacium glaucopus]
MDRRDRESRQSSLPTSLIPHLYNAPRDSSTRTTLTSHSEHSEQGRPYPLAPLIVPINRSSSYPFVRQLPPVLPENIIDRSSSLRRSTSHAFSNQISMSPTSTHLPPLLSTGIPPSPYDSSWREGEAGPSSLIHPGHRDDTFPQNRHRFNQPARPSIHPHINYGYAPRQDPGYYPSFPSPSNQSAHYGSANSHTPPLPPRHSFDSIDPSLRHDVSFYPQVGSLSISGSSPPSYLRKDKSPEHEPSYGPESLSVDIGTNEGDDGRKSKKHRANSMDTEYLSVDIGSNEGDDGHKNKKRRALSMDTDDNPKKSSRKTAVACNFCRGRKLRCNGAKPSCYNCTVRKFECEYVSTQRRRGPGKAPKGSRSRKGRSEHSGSSSVNIEHQANCSTFVVQSRSPYEQEGGQDAWIQKNQPEDHSDAKDIHRHQPGS